MQQSEIDELISYIKYDDLRSVQKFCNDHGIDSVIKLALSNGNDVFNFACSVGAVRIMSSILSDELPLGFNGINDYGYGGLHTVCSVFSGVEHKEAITALLNQGFSPNEKAIVHAGRAANDVAHTPMNLYMELGEHISTDVVRLMLRAGGDPNTLSLADSKAPILARAAEFLNIEVLKTLLEFGAEVDFVDKDNNTILHLILSKRHHKKRSKLCAEVLTMLVNVGASFTQKNSKNETALMLAGKNKHSKAAECIDKFINLSKKGKTLLQITEDIGYTKVTEYVKALPELRQKALEEKDEFKKKLHEKSIDLMRKSRAHCEEKRKVLQVQIFDYGEDAQCTKLDDKKSTETKHELSIQSKKLYNLQKVVLSILVLIFIATLVSAITLFSIKYNPVWVPIFLICASACTALLCILSLTIISGCFLDTDDKVPGENICTKFTEARETPEVHSSANEFAAIQ